MNLPYEFRVKFSIQGFIQRPDNFLGRFENNIGEVGKEKICKEVKPVLARQSQDQILPQAAILEIFRNETRGVSVDYRYSFIMIFRTCSFKIYLALYLLIISIISLFNTICDIGGFFRDFIPKTEGY